MNIILGINKFTVYGNDENTRFKTWFSKHEKIGTLFWQDSVNRK